MKFVVDSLPYYYDDCPFEYCWCKDECICPRTWSKYKVTDDNPRECEHLIEYRLMKERGDDE